MQGRDGVFHAKAAQEMAALRRLQSELEAETGNACFLGLSVASTVQQCLRLGNARAASRVRNEFRLPERHYATIQGAAQAPMFPCSSPGCWPVNACAAPPCTASSTASMSADHSVCNAASTRLAPVTQLLQHS